MALEVGSRLGHYDVTKIGEGGMGEVYRARNTKLYQALASVYELRSRMLSYFMDHDVILCPVNASPAVPHGTLLTAGTDANETVLPNYSYTITYSVTGWPGGVVRGGTSPEGLPIGVQIVGQPGREDVACGSGVLGTRVGGMATSSRRRPGSKNGSSVNHETRLVLLMVPYS